MRLQKGRRKQYPDGQKVRQTLAWTDMDPKSYRRGRVCGRLMILSSLTGVGDHDIGG